MCVSARLRNGLPRPQELEQRLEPRNATADETQLDLDRGPQPQLEAVPCDVVCLLQDVVNPVYTDAAGEDDDEAEAEEGDQREPLRERQLGVVERRQRERPYEKIKESGNGGMRDQRRCFVDAIVRVFVEVPVAVDRTVVSMVSGPHL